MSAYYLARKSFDVSASGGDERARSITWKVEKYAAIRVTKFNVSYSGHTYNRCYFDLNDTLLSDNCIEISKSEYELFSKFKRSQISAQNILQDLERTMCSKNTPWHIKGFVTCAIMEVKKLNDAYDSLAMTTINEKQLKKGTMHYDTY